MVNLGQCSTRTVGQSGTFHHTLRGTLHSGHGVLGVGLNGFHQGRDLARGVCRTFSQTLHFFRHHREAATGFTGGRGLDGGVQGQHVRLLGNVGNQLGDFTNLLRGFTQALDALGGVLDLVADGVHTTDGVLHSLQTRVGSLQRLAGHRGGLLRLRGHLVDSGCHLQHRLTGFADFPQLFGGRGQQFGRGVVHHGRGLRHTGGRVLHTAHQLAQLFHRVVHRVCNGARDVFGHGGFLGQVTLCNRLQFIHQSQNGGLVGVVDAFGLLLLALGVFLLHLGHLLAIAAIQQLHTRNAHAAQQHEHSRQCQRSQLTAAHTRLRRQLGLQTFQLTAQGFAVTQDGRLGFAGRHQSLQIAQNGAGLVAGVFIDLDQGFELFTRLCVLGGRQAQFRAAVEQALGNFLEGVQVLAEQEHGLGAHAFGRLEFVGRLADTLRQHHQLACRRNFGCLCILLQLE